MADDYTQLNPGEGGDIMDESMITYPDAPIHRKRARVVITGDNRGEIVSVTNDTPSPNSFGVVTRPVVPKQPYPGSSVMEFGEVIGVSPGTSQVVVSYTVPFGFQFFMSGFSASGDLYGKYELYVNNAITMTARTTSASPNLDKSFFGVPPSFTEGATIALKASHVLPSQAGQFQGTIIGYLCSL